MSFARLSHALALFALLLALLATSAWAHEFILVPQAAPAYKAGQAVPFRLVSAHVFMQSEELEKAANVSASYAGKEIPLTANEAQKVYEGKVTLDKPGAAILRAHRKGEVWSKTPQGVVAGDRTTLQGVVWSKKYEKFCKTLLAVDGKSDGFDQKVGDLLEIVPLTNPLTLKPGDKLTVQVLYKGQAVSPEVVTATYDGFTDTENAYAYSVEPYGEGKADIKVHAPGFWMVRVQWTVDEKTPQADAHVLRSVLAFPVAGK